MPAFAFMILSSGVKAMNTTKSCRVETSWPIRRRGRSVSWNQNAYCFFAVKTNWAGVNPGELTVSLIVPGCMVD
jgi:hypothetical protein